MSCTTRDAAAPSDLEGVAEVADRMLTPVAVLGPDSTLRYVNPAAARAVGQDPAWLVGRRMLDLIHPDDRPRVEEELRSLVAGDPESGVTTYRLRAHANWQWRVFESTAHNLLDNADIAGILVSSRDVTDQLEHEQALYQAAYRDALTGLANRAHMTVQLDEAMAADGDLSVAFLGLDRFRFINDSLGHSTGDAVLQVVACRVRSAIPADALVARFGDDLLALLVRGAASAHVRSLAWRAVERVCEPMFIAGHELRLSMSAGIAHRDAAATADSLLRDAGLALHRAKSAGGGRVEEFQPSMREAAVARLDLEANIRLGLSRSEFLVALQPIVRLSDGAPTRSEALVRWRRGDELVPPTEFIPVAEETGLIGPLGEWVINRATELVDAAPGGRIMVNLSPRQLVSPGLPERIARILAARDVAPSTIGFEVTETLLIEQFDYAVSVLNAIRDLGCPIGLDDFGTGYSSLAYLRQLPIDFLKIDRSLIQDVDSEPDARAIVGAIVTMTKALRIDVVAEGVETRAQADTLLDLGCGLAQGFLFARPEVFA